MGSIVWLAWMSYRERGLGLAPAPVWRRSPQVRSLSSTLASSQHYRARSASGLVAGAAVIARFGSGGSGGTSAGIRRRPGSIGLGPLVSAIPGR